MSRTRAAGTPKRDGKVRAAAPGGARPRRRAWWIAPAAVLAPLLVIGGYQGLGRMLNKLPIPGVVLLPDTGAGGPLRLAAYLPSLGDVQSFRRDQGAARAICRTLNLPELPDISGIDGRGQEQFYGMFTRLRNRPWDHDELGLLGQLYDAQKFGELAEVLYRRAIEMQPGDYEWHYQLGLYLEGQGKIEEASAALERAAALEPSYAPAWMRRAWRSLESGDNEAALGLVNRYVALRPEDAFGYVQRARIHNEKGDWDAMTADLEKAEQLGPVGRQGHRLLARLYRHLDRSAESAFHLHMSGEDQPDIEMDDPIGVMTRRLATSRTPELTKFGGLMDSKRYREAAELIDEVAALHRDRPDFGQIAGRISECYRQLGDYRQAYLWADKSRELIPNDPEPYVELALVLVNVGRFPEAIRNAEAALALKPEHDVALYARGLTLIQVAILDAGTPPERRAADPTETLQRALADLQKSVEGHPVNAPYLVALGTAHGMLGQYDRAREVLGTALRIIPGDDNTLALMAKAKAEASFWPVGVQP